jgi:hypothetical protein
LDFLIAIERPDLAYIPFIVVISLIPTTIHSLHKQYNTVIFGEIREQSKLSQLPSAPVVAE